MAVLAIVNPLAGNGAGADARDQLRVDFPGWECVSTRAPGEARELAGRAALDRYERVIAVGGDGTVCEVATGLAHTETALGIIAAGTGNDTARNLGIPADPHLAAAMAVRGEPRSIDLGELRTEQTATCFVNVAGFGFDAEVAARVNRMPKLIGGTLPYVVGVLQTLWQYRAPLMRVSLDDRTVEERVFLVAVANSASYGGGMRIAPGAQPDDGLLDVCLVTHVSRFDVLRLVPKMYSGGHVGHPAVKLFRSRAVSASAERSVSCQADSELVGDLPVA